MISAPRAGIREKIAVTNEAARCVTTGRPLTNLFAYTDRQAVMSVARECSVVDCNWTGQLRRGMCRIHYRRWMSTGSTELTVRPPRFCQEEDCGKPHVARGWCETHYKRWQVHGDPSHVEPSHLPPRMCGEENPSWKGNEIGYVAAHVRVRKLRGPVREKDCLHCGEAAAYWAYDHGDPNELVDERGCPYSPDPERYIPLCGSCHKVFDLAYLKTKSP